MTDDEVDSFENYSTGPFCRHYGDPSDCDDVCGRCGHLCHQHDQYEDDSECNVDNCFCNTWAEEDEVQTSLDAMKQAIDDALDKEERDEGSERGTGSKEG